MAEAIVHLLFTAHALLETQRRGLDEATVAQIVLKPEQRLMLRPGRDVFQSRVELGRRRYLVRVIVDVDRSPAQVVTAYQTSKIGKYWSDQT